MYPTINKSSQRVLDSFSKNVSKIRESRAIDYKHLDYTDIDDFFTYASKNMNKSKVVCGTHKTAIIASDRILGEWNHKGFGWIRDYRRVSRRVKD